MHTHTLIAMVLTTLPSAKENRLHMMLDHSRSQMYLRKKERKEERKREGGREGGR